ncbi:Gfo/Idh/MocA family protein [Parapedobacter pyrenivorans]|uniref:Gfo/Idh/MocA family protein n=1 Tax=Parapedobacter pyrenivorans TaxID=1305674 RepID=UPI0033422BEF
MIKVGLIGCGGRGTGAAVQALRADPQVVITALADIFEDRLADSLHALQKVDTKRTKVDPHHRFVGFDSYRQLIDSDVDVVLLASPPYFRPLHLSAAVAAGKHVFCEKPFAVDMPGVRKVLEAVKVSKEKNLALVSGFCFRYDYRKRALFEKVHQRAVGEILSLSSFRFGGELPFKPRQSHWNNLDYSLRNWHYYNWLSGDIIVEQSIHSLDMMLWAMNGRLPYKAIGTGGRQVRIAEKYGNIYDHFAVEFEFQNGVKGYHLTRQQPGCANRNTVDIVGSEGTASLEVGRRYAITGRRPWVYQGPTNNMYQTQHDALFASIRAGNPINDGGWSTNSTILAILSTMVGYSGRELTWEEALASDLTFGPPIDSFDWDTRWPTPPVAMPGTTTVI